MCLLYEKQIKTKTTKNGNELILEGWDHNIKKWENFGDNENGLSAHETYVS